MGNTKNLNDLKNYRLKYKLYYGIEFDRGYVVHHIDLNRENNDISNLLLLPTQLHTEYHTRRSAFELEINNGLILDLSRGSYCFFDYQFNRIREFADTMEKIAEWVVYKELADMGYENYPMFRRCKR